MSYRYKKYLLLPVLNYVHQLVSNRRHLKPAQRAWHINKADGVQIKDKEQEQEQKQPLR